MKNSDMSFYQWFLTSGRMDATVLSGVTIGFIWYVIFLPYFILHLGSPALIPLAVGSPCLVAAWVSLREVWKKWRAEQIGLELQRRMSKEDEDIHPHFGQYGPYTGYVLLNQYHSSMLSPQNAPLQSITYSHVQSSTQENTP